VSTHNRHTIRARHGSGGDTPRHGRAKCSAKWRAGPSPTARSFAAYFDQFDAVDVMNGDAARPAARRPAIC
jgi:hypothetical protein